MKCGNETPTSIDKICCSSWCEQLTSCFSQERSWKEDCVRMWRCRKNEKPREQFSIILTNKTDSSYLGRIKVKQCWARKPKFPAIKLTPSSEVRVFYFLVTFLVPIAIGPFISPHRVKKPIPLLAPVRATIDRNYTFARIIQMRDVSSSWNVMASKLFLM